MSNSRALMTQTVIRLAVEIETDREDILAQLLAVIMALFVGGRYVWQAASRAVYEVVMFWRDLRTAVRYVKRTWTARLSLLVYEVSGIRLWQPGELYRRFSWG